jgi:pimeloyl-ACP methyl ester carboxylesterase
MSRHFLWFLLPIGILLVGYLYRSWAEAREAASGPPIGEMVDIGGRRLHVIRRGSGSPTVILESGGASSSALWWPLQNRLAETTTVVTYDRAGLGWSDPPPLPRSIQDRSDDLALMLEKAAIPGPYVLVGLSYGGPLIRLYAKSHPDKVAGMIFVDIAHEAVFSKPAAQRYLRRVGWMLRGVGAFAALGGTRLLHIHGLPQPETSLPYTAKEEAALASRYPTARSFAVGADEFRSMEEIAAAMEGLGAPGLLDGKPVAVVSHGVPFTGQFSVLEEGHMDGQRQLAALSSNSRLVIAGKSGHAVPMEEPELVLDIIRRVVEAVRSRTPLAP